MLPQCKISGGASGHGATIGGGSFKKCKPKPPIPPATPPTPSKPKPCLRIVTDPWRCTRKVPKPHSPSASQLQQVVAELKLPDATPRFGPDPSVNEWNMLVVGYPIWLWTDGPRQQTTHVRHDGLEFTITATWQSSRFRMGDGESVTCGAMTEFRQGVDEPGHPSPTCGYVYEVVSPKGRPYQVVAEETWRIDWSSDGDHGSFVHTYQGSRSLEIGELSSLIKG